MTRHLTLPNRWSPSLFDDLRKEMNQVVESLRDTGDGAEAFFAPRANFAETDKAYEVTLDLPGMKADEFEIEFKDGRLWITGERKRENEEEGKTYHRVERSYGKFRRVVALGDDVDGERIDARYDNGVLVITLAKVEEVLPKRIKVNG